MRGVSNILTGAQSLEKCTRQLEILNNLWVLPTGPCPPNPTELLSPPSTDHVLRTLRQQFDHVTVDSPPVLLMTDATILSGMVDGVVIVVENERTSRGVLVRACRAVKTLCSE